MRLFVALNIPPELRVAAWVAVEPLRTALPTGVAWVREDALHVTLRFLGEQPDTVPDALAAALAPELARAERPTVRLEKVDAFPSMRRPRVLWLGGPANSALARLYQEVQGACATLGFEPEPRPFELHVTLGRVRPGARVDPAELARGAEQVRLDAEFVASSVDVMESVLGPGGSRYRVVAAVPIGPRGG